jgi:hypothetical protein
MTIDLITKLPALTSDPESDLLSRRGMPRLWSWVPLLLGLVTMGCVVMLKVRFSPLLALVFGMAVGFLMLFLDLIRQSTKMSLRLRDAIAFLSAGDPTTARELLETSLRQRRGSNPFMEAITFFHLGVCVFQMEDSGRGMGLIRAAFEGAGLKKATPRMMAGINAQTGILCVLDGRIEEARDWETAASANGGANHPTVAILRGLLHLKDNQVPDALVAFDQVLSSGNFPFPETMRAFAMNQANSASWKPSPGEAARLIRNWPELARFVAVQ